MSSLSWPTEFVPKWGGEAASHWSDAISQWTLSKLRIRISLKQYKRFIYYGEFRLCKWPRHVDRRSPTRRCLVTGSRRPKFIRRSFVRPLCAFGLLQEFQTAIYRWNDRWGHVKKRSLGSVRGYPGYRVNTKGLVDSESIFRHPEIVLLHLPPNLAVNDYRIQIECKLC